MRGRVAAFRREPNLVGRNPHIVPKRRRGRIVIYNDGHVPVDTQGTVGVWWRVDSRQTSGPFGGQKAAANMIEESGTLEDWIDPPCFTARRLLRDFRPHSRPSGRT